MQTYEISYRIWVPDDVPESEVRAYAKFVTHFIGSIDSNNVLYLDEPEALSVEVRKCL